MEAMDEEPKYGEPRKYDPEFKGPTQNRGCTDVICCILFVIFLIGYLAVGILAWTHGDPRKVIYPTDSRGQFCGQGSFQKQPYLFYFNIMKCASPLVLLEFQCPTPQLCVEQCPNRTMTLINAYSSPSDWQYYRGFCRQDPGPKVPTQILQEKLCPAFLISSRPFLQRCFPSLGMKGDVVTVGNNETFVDGDGNTRNAKDLLAGVQ